MEYLFSIIIAIAPAVAIAFYVYFQDRKNLIPLNLCLKAGFLGILSFFLSLGIGLTIHYFTYIEEQSLIDQLIKALIFVGFVEELSKFFFLRGFLFNNKSFRKPFDGVVLSVLVGMGFAIAENLVYAINAGGGVVIVRMFTAVPAHAFFAVIMGFYIGEAKVFRNSSRLYAFLGLFFATFAHGYYDYFLFLHFIEGAWIQTIISLAVVILATHYVFWIRKDEIIDPDLQE